MVYTLQERTEIIFTYGAENYCAHRTARAFNKRHPEKNISHRYAIALIWKFKETGSVCNKANRQPRKLDANPHIEILGHLVNEPTTSTHKILILYQNHLRRAVADFVFCKGKIVYFQHFMYGTNQNVCCNSYFWNGGCGFINEMT